jgi:hypothetical protein
MALALIKPQHRHQRRWKSGWMRRRWVMGGQAMAEESVFDVFFCVLYHFLPLIDMKIL